MLRGSSFAQLALRGAAIGSAVLANTVHGYAYEQSLFGPALSMRMSTTSRAAASSATASLPHGAEHDANHDADHEADSEADPHLWLEEVEGEAALAWCTSQNARVVRSLGDPRATPAYSRILAIADSADKIPYVGRIGGGEADACFYNFWQDATHARGVWRRTSLDSFRHKAPQWETVLSLDALNAAEARADGNAFVWHGYKLLDECPDERAMLLLSPGGTDAVVVREFDLRGCRFITTQESGFATEQPAKCDVSYRRRDELLIGTDFDGDGASLTDSGYARVVKSWTRGTPLSSARTVFSVNKSDVSAAQYAYRDRGYVHEWRLRVPSFYTTEQWYRVPDLSKSAAEDETPFVKLQVPADASVGTFGNQAIMELRSAWAPPKAPGGKQFTAGTLLAAPLPDVLAGDWGRVTALFEPSEDGSTSLQGMAATRNYIVLETSEHVNSALRFWRFDDGTKHGDKANKGDRMEAGNGPGDTRVMSGAQEDGVDERRANGSGGGTGNSGGSGAGLSETGSGGDLIRRDGMGTWHEEVREGACVRVGERVGVSAVWPDDSDALWLTRTGFLTPTTLEYASAADGCVSTEPLKAMPAHFDASGLECTQHFATSKDGTRVPYFQIGAAELPMDGSSPTLLDGYGGFEISLSPAYSGSVGAAWLMRGGVKCVANIRGGGEYGPAWHQAALRERRQRAYEDFEAVARDLIARGVTRPERLGAIGGSNGGLLMGNMITREGRALFGAVVCQVPLLDMQRYHRLLAGASWMEEYGDPDAPGVWHGYLKDISPYHRLRLAVGRRGEGDDNDADTTGLSTGTSASTPPHSGISTSAPAEKSAASSTAGEGGRAATAGTGGDTACDAAVTEPQAWPGAPKVLFTTSTRDDRVHPGHARKMVAAMLSEVPESLGGGESNCFYWENIEGGHGGAADNKQRAYMWALSYNFLWKTLSETIANSFGDDNHQDE